MTGARRRIGDLSASNRLADAGYLVLSAEDMSRMPDSLKAQLRRWLVEDADLRVPIGLRQQQRPDGAELPGTK